VRIVGFMPGVSSPGGPSHQAIDDVALMRAVPNMTVVDLADATQIRAALPSIADIPGPVYLRLKRGEIPVIFDDDHDFSLTTAQTLIDGTDLAVIASGMMLSSAVSAADSLAAGGVSASVINVPVIKPLDADSIIRAVSGVAAVITAENHSVIGGLGSAVAEAMAEAALAVPLRRIGLRDTFAEGSRTASHLFRKYRLGTQDIVDTAWELLRREGRPPRVQAAEAAEGEYAPV
jgi:transketolase